MKCFKSKYMFSYNISVLPSFIYCSFPSTTVSHTCRYFLLLAFPLRWGIRRLRSQGLAAFRLPTTRCWHNAIWKPQEKTQQPELRATEKQARESYHSLHCCPAEQQLRWKCIGYRKYKSWESMMRSRNIQKYFTVKCSERTEVSKK